MKINFLTHLTILLSLLCSNTSWSQKSDFIKLPDTEIRTVTNGGKTELIMTSTASPRIKISMIYVDQHLSEQKIDTNSDGKYDKQSFWPEQTSKSQIYKISKSYDNSGKLVQKKEFLYDKQMDVDVVLTYESPDIDKVAYAEGR